MAKDMFFWLKQITKDKSETLDNIDYDVELNESFKKNFNPYMIIRFLMMNYKYSLILNDIHGSVMKFMDNRQLYKFLLKVIPVDKGFYKYIKPVKEAGIDFDEKLFNKIYPDVNIYKNSEILSHYNKQINKYLKKIEGGVV